MTRVVTWLLRAYKRFVSPALPPACRYVPTCSEYAAEAVEHYGVARGGLKAMGRLLRCHPLARGGYDPVTPVVSSRFSVLSNRSVAGEDGVRVVNRGLRTEN